jgi:hypothetical protein
MRTTSWKASYASWENQDHASAVMYRLAPSDQEEDDSADNGRRASTSPRDEDLPYRVELWDASKTAVEQVLAVTRNGSIGYAAYYEATRQYPDRFVVLRHKGRILSRWNGPTH